MSKKELIDQYYTRLYNKNPNLKDSVEEKKVREFINKYFIKTPRNSPTK